MQTLKRWLAYFRMRCLEITVDGMSDCLDLVRDPETINRIIVAQIDARKNLRIARHEYRALRQNRVWRAAL